MNAADLIAACDPAVFSIRSETSPRDKATLLALQNAIADGGYRYVEVGSFMGGTLVPHLLDARCTSIVSIDKRPADQPDERGPRFPYHDSTTEKMLVGLRTVVPEENLRKLTTIDADASEVGAAFKGEFDLAFIDGEHTNRATFNDFLAVRRWMKSDSVVAFHDSAITFDALDNVISLLRYEGVHHRFAMLPDSVFAVFFGTMAAHPLVEAGRDWRDYATQVRRWLQRQIADAVAQGKAG